MTNKCSQFSSGLMRLLFWRPWILLPLLVALPLKNFVREVTLIFDHMISLVTYIVTLNADIITPSIYGKDRTDMHTDGEFKITVGRQRD